MKDDSLRSFLKLIPLFDYVEKVVDESTISAQLLQTEGSFQDMNEFPSIEAQSPSAAYEFIPYLQDGLIPEEVIPSNDSKSTNGKLSQSYRNAIQEAIDNV